MLSPQAQAKADANAAAVAARKAVKARNGQAGEKGKGVKDQAGVGGKSTTKAEANAAATAAREAANSKKDQAGSKVNATAKVSDSIAGPASGTEPLESAETGGTPPKKATTKPLPAVLVPGSHRQAQNKRILSAGREKSNVDTNISETVDFVLSETFLENKSPGGSRSVQARGGAYPYIPRILSENATGSSSNTVATGIADTGECGHSLHSLPCILSPFAHSSSTQAGRYTHVMCFADVHSLPIATAETPTPPTTAAKDQALAIRAARHRSATSAPRSLEATLRNSFPSSRAISVSSSHTSSTEDFSDINVEGDQIDRMFNDLEADMERMEKETEKGKGKKVDKEIHKGYYKGKGKEKEK